MTCSDISIEYFRNETKARKAHEQSCLARNEGKLKKAIFFQRKAAFYYMMTRELAFLITFKAQAAE